MACGQFALQINFAWQQYNAGLSGNWSESTIVQEKRGESVGVLMVTSHFSRFKEIFCLHAKRLSNKRRDDEEEAMQIL